MSSGSRPVLTVVRVQRRCRFSSRIVVYKKKGGRRISTMYKEILEMANRVRFEFPCSVGARDWMVRKTMPTMVLFAFCDVAVGICNGVVSRFDVCEGAGVAGPG